MINIHEAKTRLSELLAQVEAGSEIVVSRAGKPIAKLVPYKRPKRLLGYDVGLGAEIAEDFDRYIPPEFEEYL
jgi:prevent-host-death family protein